MPSYSASLDIVGLPAFADNYIWVVRQAQRAIVIDPGDAAVVTAWLRQHQLHLDAILLTHHHADHTGGAKWLQRQWLCTVFGPDAAQPVYEDLVDTPVHAHQQYLVPHWPQLTLSVMALPGHTADHVAYLLNGQYLFCGDVLFGAGCGRLFEGTAAQMYDSLQTIAALPVTTQIFPAHEYTLKNLEFACMVDPEHAPTQIRYEQVRQLRAAGLPSLPTTLATELETNPFLRCAALRLLRQYRGQSELEIFSQLRFARNDY